MPCEFAKSWLHLRVTVTLTNAWKLIGQRWMNARSLLKTDLNRFLGSLRKQTDFPPIALRRRKIPSAKPSRKTTSLTPQDFDQSKCSSQKPRTNAREVHAKTWRLRGLLQSVWGFRRLVISLRLLKVCASYPVPSVSNGFRRQRFSWRSMNCFLLRRFWGFDAGSQLKDFRVLGTKRWRVHLCTLRTLAEVKCESRRFQ